MSKKLIILLRHGSLLRDNDGAIEFLIIKDYLQDHFVFCHHWSDEKWKSSMAGGGGNKKRFQYCTDSSGQDRWKVCLAAGGGAKIRFQYCTGNSGTITCFRALQGHSGRNLIDLHYRTMPLFRAASSSTFIMSDVQSIYMPSSIRN